MNIQKCNIQPVSMETYKLRVNFQTRSDIGNLSQDVIVLLQHMELQHQTRRTRQNLVIY